jgi:hypothetical protein
MNVQIYYCLEFIFRNKLELIFDSDSKMLKTKKASEKSEALL